MNGFIVEPAHPNELTTAFRLLFQRYPPETVAGRSANALVALERGELDPAGILVARGADGLLGVLACLPLRGASGLVWPPEVAPGADVIPVEDRLIGQALDLLRRRGSRIAQALLVPDEAHLAAPLLRHGFQHITTLEYLRHPLDQQSDVAAPVESDDAAERLTYRVYDDTTAAVFHETLLRTYEGALDCPELNDVRSIADIIAGHQSQGRYDPQRWWLAQENERPVGVLLLIELPDWRSLDVSYLGVVPEARGRGLGRELTCRALRTARAAGLAQSTLAVDRRNLPARYLYARLGFECFDAREVYLTFLACPPDVSRPENGL